MQSDAIKCCELMQAQVVIKQNNIARQEKSVRVRECVIGVCSKNMNMERHAPKTLWGTIEEPSKHDSDSILEMSLDVARLAAKIPETLVHDLSWKPVRDQKRSCACVPACIADVIDWHNFNSFVRDGRPVQQASNTGKDVGTSAKMLYDMRSVLTQKGSSCQESLRIARDHGCWPASLYTEFRRLAASVSTNTTTVVMKRTNDADNGTTRTPASTATVTMKDKTHTLANANTNVTATAKNNSKTTTVPENLSLSKMCHIVGMIPGAVRIAAFFRISTLKGVKVALATFGPCILLTPCYNTSPTFWRPSRKNYERYLQRGKKLHCDPSVVLAGGIIGSTQAVVPLTTSAHCTVWRGFGRETTQDQLDDQITEIERLPDLIPTPRKYHCVLVVGYDKHGLLIRNSWSANWASNGNTQMPYADFDKYAVEAWVITGLARGDGVAR